MYAFLASPLEGSQKHKSKNHAARATATVIWTFEDNENGIQEAHRDDNVKQVISFFAYNLTLKLIPSSAPSRNKPQIHRDIPLKIVHIRRVRREPPLRPHSIIALPLRHGNPMAAPSGIGVPQPQVGPAVDDLPVTVKSLGPDQVLVLPRVGGDAELRLAFAAGAAQYERIVVLLIGVGVGVRRLFFLFVNGDEPAPRRIRNQGRWMLGISARDQVSPSVLR